MVGGVDVVIVEVVWSVGTRVPLNCEVNCDSDCCEGMVEPVTSALGEISEAEAW